MKTKAKFVIAAGIFIAVIISTQFGNSRVSLFNLTADNSNSNNDIGTNNNSNSEVSSQSRILRIGYFPNLNHAQAVIGLQQGGEFQKFMNANNNNNTNSGVRIEPFVFSAGPTAIEALLGVR